MDDHYVNYKGIADALALKTGQPVMADDVEAWCDGDGTTAQINHVDRLVRQLLGKKTYQEYMRSARLVDAMTYRLGLGSRYAGGVDVSRNFD